MRSELLVDEAFRSHVIVMDEGDECVNRLNDFLEQGAIRSGRVSAIGAFASATLGWYDPEARRYQPIPIREQVEVVSFVGDVALRPDGLPRLHAHCVVADRDGRTYGGHLVEGVVRPTLELFLQEIALGLQRRHDERTGLDLLVVPTQ